MVQPLRDVDIQPGVGELEHDFVENVGRRFVSGFVVSEERLNPFVHGVPAVHRVVEFWHFRQNILAQLLVRYKRYNLYVPRSK